MKPIFDKHPKRTRIVVGISGAFAVIAIVASTLGGSPKQEAIALKSPAKAALAPSFGNSSNFSTGASTPSVRDRPAPTTSTGESRQALIDRLAKTGNPEDAFAAYRVLLACKLQDLCGDLTPGQKTMAYNLLKQAVAGHVPKASIYLLITTPDGRPPYEVYGDPAYASWEADARREIADAADRGDAAALQQMAELSARDNQPEKALAYWTAYTDRSPATYKQFFESIATSRFAHGLSPEQVAAAIAEGHAMNGGTK